MAEIAKEDIDAIVSAIGFGIVNDFRSLQDAMRVMTAQSTENNRLLGEVNENLSSTDKSLERLEKDIYRQINTRQFTELENSAEKKAKASSKRADQILNDVQKSLSGLQKETIRGINRENMYDRSNSRKDTSDDGPSSDAEVNKFISDAQTVGGGVGGGGGQSLLPDLTGGVGAGAAMATVGAVAAGAIAVGGAAYLMKNDSESSSGALTPAEAPAPSAPSIGVTQNKGTSTQTPTASTTGAVSAATQNVSAVTTSLRSKALAKITNKLADWINKNGDKVKAIIGPNNTELFGKLVGGTFTFSKYMTDSSWTGLGEQYVLGNSITPGQTKNQNAAYVAGVVVNLAILAYLACRDVYTRENYDDIQSGAVQNFDDLGSSEKSQYVKNAGSQIENYVNKLISEASTKTSSVADDTASVTPSPAAASTAAGLSPTTTGGTPPAPETNESSETGLGSGSVGNNTAAGGGAGAMMGGATALGATALAGGGGDLQQATSIFESIGASQAGSNGDATAYGGNNIAVFSTSNDVLSDTSGSGKAAGASWGSSSERANIVMNTLMANGFTNEQAVDMTANFMQESGQNLDSGAVGDKAQGLNSFGIGQWNRERKQRLIAFAKERGKPVTDIETQTQFAIWELNNTHKRAGANFFAARNTDERYYVLRHQYEVGIENRKAFDAARKTLEGTDYDNRSDSATQQAPEEEGESTVTVPAAAKGAIITPLPKAPTDTINLAPPSFDGTSEDDEDDFTTSSNAIDARPKTYSANPLDEVKNKLSFYDDYMQHHFGYLSQEFDLHTSGELTADEAYKRAMNPLGRR